MLLKAAKKLLKSSTNGIGRTNLTDRQTDRWQTGGPCHKANIT